jgi:hypothetical protein
VGLSSVWNSKYQRWLNLFLASQQLIRGRIFVECDDQSWFNVQDVFAYPWEYWLSWQVSLSPRFKCFSYGGKSENKKLWHFPLFPSTVMFWDTKRDGHTEGGCEFRCQETVFFQLTPSDRHTGKHATVSPLPVHFIFRPWGQICKSTSQVVFRKRKVFRTKNNKLRRLSLSELYRPSVRCLSTKLVPNFAEREVSQSQHDGSLTAVISIF